MGRVDNQLISILKKSDAQEAVIFVFIFLTSIDQSPLMRSVKIIFEILQKKIFNLPLRFWRIKHNII